MENSKEVLTDLFCNKIPKMNNVNSINSEIAEFMEYEKDVYFPNIKYLIPNISDVENAVVWKMDYDLKFHKSWDWLMPLIKKLDSLASEKLTFSEFENYRTNWAMIDKPSKYPIEKVHEQAHQFIQWLKNKENE
ncbi:hypothetical protein [Polaribacter sp.]|uniref:hypothetical protein n=1 Tax=Polaribacter sp. TaxID=1920175 RepID=UPI003F6CD028